MSDKDVREAVARSICGKNCDMPKCSFQPDADNQAMCRLMSLEDADAAITAYEAALKDQGLVIVPVVPSEEMLSCLLEGEPGKWPAGAFAEFYGTRESMEENWTAMLSASQPKGE